jgi:predicted ArsR family transcriptional regulator
MRKSLQSQVLETLKLKYPFELTHWEIEELGKSLGFLGETARRRCYDLKKLGLIEIEERHETNGKSFTTFKYKLPTNEKGLRAYYKDTGRLKVEIVEVNGQRVARETIV